MPFQKGNKLASLRKSIGGCCSPNYIGPQGFPKGHIPWNKGKRYKISKISKARRRHLSFTTEFKKGHIPWSKGKKGICLNTGRTHFNGLYSGIKHWNWKGGITPINEKLRRNKKYFLWRKAIFARDNYICQFCGKKGGKLHADHIKPFSEYKELRYNINNGRTLCIECHNLIGWKGSHIYE